MIVWTELVAQVPFMIVAIYAFLRRRNWIRIPAIAFAAHVITTMIVILGELAQFDMTLGDKLSLISFYIPFLILPVVLLCRMMRDKPFLQEKNVKVE
jgi:hypothetical protein